MQRSFSRVPPPPARPDVPEGHVSTNKWAVVSLVLGLVGVLTFWAFAITGILAVVFGAVALGQIERSLYSEEGRGMALWGIALGAIQIVGFVFFVVFLSVSGSHG